MKIKKTKELCEIALNSNPMAIEYIPDKFKDKEMYNKLLEKNIYTAVYIPEKMKNKKKYIEILEEIIINQNNNNLDQYHINEIVNSFPKRLHKDKEIIKLERRVGARRFTKKTFDKDKNIFITVERISYYDEEDIKEFKRFKDFYDYIDGNLINADLYEYNFKGIDLKEFNIEGAYIKTDILINQNLYNNDYYYNKIEKNIDKIIESNYAEENDELIKPENILHEIEESDTFNNDCRKIYYISDIHLCHKLYKRFPKYATKIEMIKYIENIIDNMIKTASDRTYYDYLLVGGDVSTDYEFSEIFYTILSKKWRGRIIAILGNHELWNINNQMECKTLEEIYNKYREMFERLNITFLQNELLFEIQEGYMPRLIKISEKEILDLSQKDIQQMSMQSRLIILGGIGFSGLNKIHNASIGLYRDTVPTLEEDKKETDKFNKIYNKLNKFLNSDKVIIFTHTPKENWNKDEYNCNWIYVNGHTHRNNYFCDNERTVYADNQIGYYNTSAGLKFFELTNKFDFFKYYSNGIYTITRDQYIMFNRGINVRHMQFNVIDGEIYMLKRSNIYCFIYKNEKGKIYLLNGGQRLNLENQDIDYYYDKMDIFSQITKKAIKGYNNILKSISDVIKSFGGDGTIHGCIIDIDFLNHIYVNPYDGTITPYFAFSIVDKFIYKNIETLLLENRKDLYQNYIKLIKEQGKDIKLLLGNKREFTDLITSNYFPETFMYSPSNKMKTIQYLTEMNVIRFWNNEIINKADVTIKDKTRTKLISN